MVHNIWTDVQLLLRQIMSQVEEPPTNKTIDRWLTPTHNPTYVPTPESWVTWSKCEQQRNVTEFFFTWERHIVKMIQHTSHFLPTSSKYLAARVCLLCWQSPVFVPTWTCARSVTLLAILQDRSIRNLRISALFIVLSKQSFQTILSATDKAEPNH